MMKWAISESEKDFFGLWYKVYHKAVQAGMGFTMDVLTFLYTSFANLFCQNNVKKNCKSGSRVFNECDDIGRRKGCKRYDSDGRL